MNYLLGFLTLKRLTIASMIEIRVFIFLETKCGHYTLKMYSFKYRENKHCLQIKLVCRKDLCLEMSDF